MEKGRVEITEQPEQAKEIPQPKAGQETKKRETARHFTTDLDNAYGEVWAKVVQEYLKTNYKNGNDSREACKVIVSGITYQVLERKQKNITVFYDADGNTLFDVENKRLEREYTGMMNPEKEPEKGAAPKTGDVSEQKLTEDGKNLEESAGEAKRKVYTSGAEKIRDEAEAEYQAAKDEESKAFTKAKMNEVVKYVSEKCETDPEYNALVIQEHKTWERCDQFMLEKAKKMAPAGSPGMIVEGSTIFEWMDEYYQADDLEKIKAEEEEARKEAERRKERLKKEEAERAAKAKKKPAKAVRAPKKKADTPKEQAKPKKNNMDIDGQMDLFSMMEM